MRIKDDFSHINESDKKAIENGVAVLDLHSIRIDRYFTEQEMQENKRQAEILSREEWGKRCDDLRANASKIGEKIMQEISEHFSLEQYEKPCNYKDKTKYDLFFWCGRNAGAQDFSYITLSFYDEYTHEEREATLEKAVELLKGIDENSMQAIIQYKVIYNEERLKEIATEFFTAKKGQFITHGRTVGRLVEIEPTLNYGYKYAFMKKNAKSKGVRLTEKEIYGLSVENEFEIEVN